MAVDGGEPIAARDCVHKRGEPDLVEDVDAWTGNGDPSGAGREPGRRVLRRELGMTAVGAAVGLSVFRCLGRVLESPLYEVSPTDGGNTAVVLVLAGVAMGACWRPVWEAWRLEPVAVLRES